MPRRDDDSGRPHVILALDEAQALYEDHGWCNFDILQKAINVLHGMPFHALSISATMRLPPPTYENPDLRRADGRLRLPKPFTDFGFDWVTEGNRGNASLSLSDVTEERFMVNFGRPL